MAIDSTILIDSAAAPNTAGANTLLGSQTQQSGSNTVIFPDALSADNNGNLVATPVYTSRLVVIRPGLSNEETRYITGTTAGTGTTVIATVHEDWISAPTSTDAWHICYLPVDADTVGNNFKLLSKRDTDWVAAQKMTIGDGTNFAWFALVDGHSIETVDNSSTTIADIIVKSSGRFDNGYLATGTPVSGGYIVGTPAIAGELVFDSQSGSDIRANDFFLTEGKANCKSYWNGTVDFQKAKIYKSCYNGEFGGIVSAVDLSIEGIGTTNDNVKVDASFTPSNVNIINTNGFDTLTTTGAETITINNPTFVNNLKQITIQQDKTWELVNPTGLIGDSTNLSFQSATGTEVDELYELNLIVQTAAGTKLQNAYTYVYEGLLNQNLPTANKQATDVDGLASSNVLKTAYTFPASVFTTTTSGDFAVKVYKYTYSPFVTAQVFTGEVNSTITLIPDSGISEQTQATAITNGSGITVTEETNRAILLSYDTGTIAFLVNDVVTGLTSGASGTVVKVEEGDTTSGRIFLKSCNTTDFIDNENLQVSAATYAVSDLTTGEQLKFKWWVDCNSKSLQITYDYLAAKMAEATPDAIFISAIEWGEDEQSQLMYSGTAGYSSERNINLTAGVFLTNRGAGTIDYLTSDGGTQYTPPSTVSLTIELRDDTGTLITSATEITVVKDSDTSVLYHVENVTTGSTVYTFDSTLAGTAYYITAINVADYEIKDVSGVTLPSGDTTLIISLTNERNYNNP